VAGEVARRRGDVEVVAVDAFTLYRGLDIGTAKPSTEDRAAVPHHMVDVLDPTDAADVAWFQGAARAAIADVQERGRVPLLVGGSGLYFRAVVDDLRFPPTDPAVRAELEERWADDPVGAHAEVARQDPTAAARIEPGNLRRSVRALEVMQITGELFSAFATADRASIYPGLVVAYLEPDRALHRLAVQQRAEAMVAAGLVDELRALRRRWGALSSTAAQGIGYGEAGAVLDGELSIDDLADEVARRTWAYARRQRSWFRRDPRCQPPSSVDRAVDRFVAAGAT
jgi:tRNA dimethylallyltransferase